MSGPDGTYDAAMSSKLVGMSTIERIGATSSANTVGAEFTVGPARVEDHEPVEGANVTRAGVTPNGREARLMSSLRPSPVVRQAILVRLHGACSPVLCSWPAAWEQP